MQPASLAGATGLIGGFALARTTGKRQLGGALFAAAGLTAARGWYRAGGPPAAAGMGLVYTAAMGVSHPLARKVGAWPSVVGVTALTVAASEVVGRR